MHAAVQTYVYKSCKINNIVVIFLVCEVFLSESSYNAWQKSCSLGLKKQIDKSLTKALW